MAVVYYTAIKSGYPLLQSHAFIFYYRVIHQMSKQNQKAPKGGKKKLLLIILATLITAGIAGAGGYTYFELQNIKTQMANPQQAKENTAPPESVMPVYADIDTFTVSLKPENDNSDHVLYIGLTLKMQDDAAKALLEKYLPEVRSRLLVLFSQQTANNLSADGGKEKLIEEIKTVVSTPLTGQQKIMVTDVLFNAFILR